MASALPVIASIMGIIGAGTGIAQQFGAFGDPSPGIDYGTLFAQPSQIPGLVTPRDPSKAVPGRRAELQTRGLTGASPEFVSRMTSGGIGGLTPEEWELIVQGGGF